MKGDPEQLAYGAFADRHGRYVRPERCSGTRASLHRSSRSLQEQPLTGICLIMLILRQVVVSTAGFTYLGVRTRSRADNVLTPVRATHSTTLTELDTQRPRGLSGPVTEVLPFRADCAFPCAGQGLQAQQQCLADPCRDVQALLRVQICEHCTIEPSPGNTDLYYPWASCI